MQSGWCIYGLMILQGTMIPKREEKKKDQKDKASCRKMNIIKFLSSYKSRLEILACLLWSNILLWTGMVSFLLTGRRIQNSSFGRESQPAGKVNSITFICSVHNYY